MKQLTPKRNTKKYKETQRNTKKHKETQRNTKKHKERRDHKGTLVPLLGSPKKLKNPFYFSNNVLLFNKILKMNTTNKNNMNNKYNTKKEIQKIENDNAAKSELISKDDDDCFFTKPLKPFEPELYVTFPKDSLTFDDLPIDIRRPEYITQLDYLREKSVRVACSRNFCGNA